MCIHKVRRNVMVQRTVFLAELEQVFHNFHTYNIKISLGDINEKLGRGNIFKPTIGNERLHQDSNGNGVTIVNLATSKNLAVQSTIFPHRDIHKYTWTSPDGKTHNQIDNILINRRWHSIILDVPSSKGAAFATDNYLMVA
jgi:hypothetical protein